jgi:thiosulfate dehydrogenase
MKAEEEKELVRAVVKLSKYTVLIAVLTVICMVMLIIILAVPRQVISAAVVVEKKSNIPIVAADVSEAGATTRRTIPGDAWKAPDANTIPAGKAGEMIRYGLMLLSNTASYLGPQGSVAHITNGMNCQNCHLAGGTRLFGNDYAGFIASYPKMSGRSGKVEPASERISECFERSLAGKAPDTSKREVQSILAYMKWIGGNVKKGRQLFGSATEKLAFMNTPTDPAKGKEVFVAKCQSCHGLNGEGLLAVDKKSYTYPPLWGKHSYNDGAGMYRVINLAGFVKNNMPFGATYQVPQLTDEEAWNVAAFINSQPRPHKDQHNDWKDLSKKPIDFPFGPYADNISEKQHKYGPFKPIKDARKVLTNKKS